jgi:DNA-3-methyladenine glycosylase II
MARPLTKRQLTDAVAHLRARDAAFVPILDYVGPCVFEARTDPFMALVDIVAAQQVSKYAAESIRTKLRLRYGDPVDPAKIARAREASLRACSLSGAKIVSLREITRAVVSGAFDFAALERLDDAAAIERLVALKGIGRWTAEIYLMFVLGRPDIFPIGDVALRKLMRQVYGLAEDAPLPAYLAVAEAWAPYRTVASWYLYAWINRRRAEARISKGSMTETLV